MLSTFLALFIAGTLTIFLPCILPLVPIVLGVSISGRHPLRPLMTVMGMVVSFVVFTMVLLTVLQTSVLLADLVRVATYYILFLFGVGFAVTNRTGQLLLSVLGGFFFSSFGWIAVTVAQTLGALAMEVGGTIAARLQQWGTTLQGKARGRFGGESLLTAFIIGLTLGLVWVPCAGPALGFAFTLVREEPGLRAAFLLFGYATGTAIPLLAIGYGGQTAAHRVKALVGYSNTIKRIAGVLLILSAAGLQYRFFEKVQIFLLDYTSFGDLGTRLEERLFPRELFDQQRPKQSGQLSSLPPPPPLPPMSSISAMFSRASVGSEPSAPSSSPIPMALPKLPTIVRAPQFQKLGPWHNLPEPLTLAGLKGSVVLVDFWTYSCINCIRTLPHIQGYWEQFGGLQRSDGAPAFMLLGVHTPEFVFEKSEANVADAIRRHGLTYPVAQDNSYGTWNAFSNHYWPAKYLIDAQGYIRYTHFGEGGYQETADAIQSLLQEINVNANMEGISTQESQAQRRRSQTPETYLGSRSWPALGNSQGEPTLQTVSYPAPSAMDLHHYYLVGDWKLKEDERQVLQSKNGEIRMKFLGSEINLVMGMEQGSPPASVQVLVDGVAEQTFTIDYQDLFSLWKGEYGEHEIILEIEGNGAAGYAFTFGA